jgi:catalase-peroxidase
MKKVMTVLAITIFLTGFAQEKVVECPMGHGSIKTETTLQREKAMSVTSNNDWWPSKLNLDVLRQNSTKSSPMGADFDYRSSFAALDYAAIKKDIATTLTDSKVWWPADFGNYGPLFIRMAWHSAGTYRSADGRGGSRAGQQRFAPLNSWPDNANLDKARRLLWPIKQKYGSKISWADLMILAGNVALENMGFKTFGFSGGREDVWEPESDVYWGSEKKWLDENRYSEGRKLENPLAAVQMGLIYVNPEGVNGDPDPKRSALDIRETFKRMGMNDEETVALIAGGHTFGKTHGMGPATNVGAEPEAAEIHDQGFGWKSTYGTGVGKDAITSGLEVTWTPTPTQWGFAFFKILFENEWELTKSPAGAHQWVAKNAKAIIPDAFDKSKFHRPTMLTTDLSLRFDPIYETISKRFLEKPELFEETFAKAWFKLTHRDMGPKSTYIGPEAPKVDMIWQDPIPSLNHKLIEEGDITLIKTKIANSGLSIAEMVGTAWASASTYRQSDRRGGANGARILLEPMKNWEVNNPKQLMKVSTVLLKIQKEFNDRKDGKKVSMADLIVLSGIVGVEMAANNNGVTIKIPFKPGRMDALQSQTDIESMKLLEPMADGFRNYLKTSYTIPTEQLLVDKAQLLTLSPPEMTVLLGGLRSLGITYDNSNTGLLITSKERLSNEFFVNLLDMKYEMPAVDEKKEFFNVIDRSTKEKKWVATRADLIFGSNSELRALAEVYASSDMKVKFVNDFAAAWNKVMELDRFDLVK